MPASSARSQGARAAAEETEQHADSTPSRRVCSLRRRLRLQAGACGLWRGCPTGRRTGDGGRRRPVRFAELRLRRRARAAAVFARIGRGRAGRAPRRRRRRQRVDGRAPLKIVSASVACILTQKLAMTGREEGGRPQAGEAWGRGRALAPHLQPACGVTPCANPPPLHKHAEGESAVSGHLNVSALQSPARRQPRRGVSRTSSPAHPPAASCR